RIVEPAGDHNRQCIVETKGDRNRHLSRGKCRLPGPPPSLGSPTRPSLAASAESVVVQYRREFRGKPLLGLRCRTAAVARVWQSPCELHARQYGASATNLHDALSARHDRSSTMHCRKYLYDAVSVRNSRSTQT